MNPPTARAETGYVDFYTDVDLGLSWEVKRAPEPGGEMQVVFSQFEPVQGNILRLSATPGAYRFEVWFNNQVTTGPQVVRVQLANGQVTPVHVTLTPAGSTLIDVKEYSFRGSTKGYARGTKIHRQENEMQQIGLSAEDSRAYQPRERMAYFSAGK